MLRPRDAAALLLSAENGHLTRVGQYPDLEVSGRSFRQIVEGPLHFGVRHVRGDVHEQRGLVVKSYCRGMVSKGPRTPAASN